MRQLLLLICVFVSLSSVVGCSGRKTQELTQEQLDSIARIEDSIKAQTEYVLFMGIPMNKTYKEFVLELTNKDFKERFRVENHHYGLVDGYFGGQECCFQLNYSEVTENVYNIEVDLKNQSDWSIIKKQYDELSGAMTSKYGEPIIVEEDDMGRLESRLFREYFSGNVYRSWSVKYGTFAIGQVFLFIKTYFDELYLKIVYCDYKQSKKSINENGKELTKDI